MLTQADLKFCVDLGSSHLPRFTNIPTIGLWRLGHVPTTYTVPRPKSLSVVLADHARQWHKFKRLPRNIDKHPGCACDAHMLADIIH